MGVPFFDVIKIEKSVLKMTHFISRIINFDKFFLLNDESDVSKQINFTLLFYDKFSVINDTPIQA